MRVMSLVALLVGTGSTLMAAPQISQEEAAELRSTVQEFLAGQDVDLARLNDLAQTAIAAGTIQFGMHDHVLTQLAGAIEIAAPARQELACITTVDAPIDIPGTPPRYTEDISITRNEGGATEVEYVTIDPESELSISLTWDGAEAVLGLLTYRDSYDNLRYELQTDGNYLEANSGMVTNPRSPEAQLIAAIRDNVVPTNPSWFYSGVNVVQGQPALRPGDEESVFQTISALASSFGTLPAGFEPALLISAVTGQTEIDGDAHIVFEMLFEVAFHGGTGPDVLIRAGVAEEYQISTMARTRMAGTIFARSGSSEMQMLQEQTCEVH